MEIRLRCESLDAEADIFLNGSWVGHQHSAFFPFVINVKEHLVVGTNTLVIRVTSGLEYVSEQDMSLINEYCATSGQRGDVRRPFVRKSQYQFGWDHAPRLVTCGIQGHISLECIEAVHLAALHIRTEAIYDTTADMYLMLEVENTHPYTSYEGSIEFSIAFANQQIIHQTQAVFLQSGINFLNFTVKIPDANLWWPHGMGAQPLYTLEARVLAGKAISTADPIRFGIRTVQLDTSKLGEGERNFSLVINGINTFCQGGNWVPADSIYTRVTDEQYTLLLQEAAAANFNMLRIWGGGIYEKDIFYQLCDELGLMVWQDFMFSCALYPDHLPWFREQVAQEADYQTRRLRKHPSLVLFCGSNENTWGFQE